MLRITGLLFFMGLIDFLFGKKKEQDSQRFHSMNDCADNLNRIPADKIKGENNISSSVGSNSAILSTMDTLVKRCIQLEPKGEIDSLQNSLYQLYGLFNKPGCSKYIVQYDDKLNLGLCFIFMLHYDWINDSDIREVWAEDAFYCIQEYLDNQPYGRQGQAEGMIIYFTLLCVGRESLKPKIQDILNRGEILGNRLFHREDYSLGAQHVIDQFSLLAVSGIRDLGDKAIPVMFQICQKYNGLDFFQKTISRSDLMKYDPMDIILKARFVRDVVGAILKEA